MTMTATDPSTFTPNQAHGCWWSLGTPGQLTLKALASRGTWAEPGNADLQGLRHLEAAGLVSWDADGWVLTTNGALVMKHRNDAERGISRPLYPHPETGMWLTKGEARKLGLLPEGE